MRSKQGGIKAWLIFILIIVIAFGALYYFRSVAPESTEEPVTVEEVKMPKKKFTKKTISDEKKIEMDTVAMENAIEGGNVDDCEKITYDEDLKKQCQDGLGYAEILRSGDESACEELHNEDLKAQCLDKIYYNEAMDNMDTSLCNKISNDELKQRCLDQIQVVMGKDAESAEDCESISDSTLKQECLNNYYYTSSIEALDEESCDNITNIKLKESCSGTVTQNKEVAELIEDQKAAEPLTTKELLSDCDNYDGDDADNCKDDKNYELALEEKDISYCDRISDVTLQKECVDKQGDSINQFYFRQGMALGSSKLCEKITNTELKTLCLDSL